MLLICVKACKQLLQKMSLEKLAPTPGGVIAGSTRGTLNTNSANTSAGGAPVIGIAGIYD